MSESALSGLLVGLGVFAIVLVLICIVVCELYIIGKWKLFLKAGKEGWETIIPFYSDWVLCEISGLEWYWFLIVDAAAIITILSTVSSAIGNLSYLANIAGIFGYVSVFYNLSKKLHKDTSFIVLGALFTPIMICVAGFSNNYVYDKNVVVDKNGIIEKMTNKTSNVQSQPVNNTVVNNTPVNPTNTVVEQNANNTQENINNNQNNTTM